jgi:hypothetical protein
MKLKVFEELIATIKEADKKVDDAYKVEVDLVNFVDSHNKAINLLLKVYYGQLGYDWISWFCDEKFSDSREPLQAFDKNKREICKDVKGLWTMIEKDRKSKDFVEYVIPKSMTDKQREQFLNSIFSKA